ncbi:MAG: efflux transporter outer membrane subunit, partial [Bacteroidaceae bacterium]|nr:efflux transporter outer membrane subunit [Bacteroidaceae bacterium]
EVFTDPQLQELIRLSLEKNFDLLKAAENVKMAEAQLRAARLAFLPSFSFNPSASLSKILSGPNRDEEWSRSYNLPVMATWNVDLFGNLLSQNRSSKAALIASKDYQQAVRSRVVCGVANCYYTLLMLDRQLEILNDVEQITKENWDMMKLQKELRGARETAVVAAQAAHLNVISQKIDMQRQIRETENTLSLLLGQPAQTIGRGRLEEQLLPSNFATGVNIKLLSNRPDVHAAEMNLAQCFYNVETARSRFYPSISIGSSPSTGLFTFTQMATGAEINPAYWLFNAVAALTQPIFQNGKLVAGLKVAKAQYQQAYYDWEYSILSAGSEISNALVLYNSSNQKSIVDRERVDVLKKSVEYTRNLFKMGSSTYLEVITAQQNLLNAELTQVADDFNKMQAVVNLYSALGGGR